MLAESSTANLILQQRGCLLPTGGAISLADMPAPRSRNITPADIQAAERLRAIWQALPRDQRPTQQQLADAWEWGEANQSLISQYMTGRIALNYRAVRFFAAQLGCDETAIRSDLPEQRLGAVTTPKLSTGLPPAASQPMRSTGRTLAIAAGALTRFLARRDMQLDVTKEIDAELLLAVVAEYEASRNDPDADTAFVVALADLVQAYEAKRNGGDGRGSEQAVGVA